MHDWLTGLRGGERVLDAFCEIFPTAPLYTLVHVPGTTSKRIEARPIRTSFLNRFPAIDRHYRRLLPLMPTAAERMKISEATDLVVSSHHCTIKAVPKPPGAVHVSYIHSPMRYIYDQYDNYFGPQASLSARLGGRVFRDYLTRWDASSNKNVDVMIANSAFVRERIRRYYQRDAEVVHPFVELDDFSSVRQNPPGKGEAFVMVTAFAPNKRVDLAIQAFNHLKLPLLIAGGGQLTDRLKTMAGPTVRFLGSLTRAEVIDLLARGQALIFPGIEDFGITPLEALAAGTPVIAFRAGGVLETLSEENSVFFNEATVESLVEAVRRFQRLDLRPNYAQLEKFSRGRFIANMSRVFADARATGPSSR